MLWVKALHVISVMMWVGPLLLLTQLLALHASEEAASGEVLQRVEKRFFGSIVNPAAAVVLMTGLIIVLSAPATYLRMHWLHVKLLLAVVLFGLHLRIFLRMRALHANPSRITARTFPILHGIGALAVILIVILVITKPF